MKRIWLVLLLACISTTAISAPPNNPLEIVISHPESTREAESGVVVFTMKNRSDAPIYVLKPRTPFYVMEEEHLFNNLFDVIDSHGKRAKYTRMYVDGVEYTSEGIDAKSFVKMNPGESLSRKINLSKSYDLSAGGAYTVRYSRPLLGTPTGTDKHGIVRFEQTGLDQWPTSNTLDIWINAALLPQDKTLGLLDTEQPAVCEAPKQTVIDTAMSRAKTLSMSATQYNASLLYYEGEGETFTAKLKEDFRMNNWFGSYEANWRPALDPNWINTENFFPTNITSAIAVRLNFRPMSFDCSCAPEWNVSPTTGAVALANQKIGVCPQFFEIADTGLDTKAGALVHEAAHFSDDLAQGLFDIEYGPGKSSALAKNNPSAAKRNPDNYKFFVESGGL